MVYTFFFFLIGVLEETMLTHFIWKDDDIPQTDHSVYTPKYHKALVGFQT